MRRKTIILCIIFLFAINDGLCQVRDPGKDASVDEHYDQVFHLARKYCIIHGCRRELELLCTDTGYLPQESHIPEEIGFSESFYTGLTPKHHCRSVWPLNMIPCYFNQKMTVDGHVDLLQL
jgi:hypothetical protein